MSELSRALRNELSGDFPQGNPLVTIGVSAQILDLGLSADELFEYITKDVARRLILRFHADHLLHTDHGGVEGEQSEVALLRGRLGDAYRDLQNREIFDRALAHFRSLKAEDRRETKILRAALEAARQKLTTYESREVELSQTGRQIERVKDAVEREKVVQARIIPGLEGDIARQEKTIRSREASLRHHRQLSRGLTRYVSYLGMHDDPAMPYPHAFKAGWIAIASLVPYEHLEASPQALSENKVWTNEFQAAVEPLGIPPHELRRIQIRWRRWYRHFGIPAEQESYQTYELRLHVLELSLGKGTVVYGLPDVVSGGIIGSVPVVPPAKFGRQDLIYKISSDTVVENFVPFLVPGNLLVSQVVRRMVEEPSTRRKVPVMTRNTKHLILGAG